MMRESLAEKWCVDSEGGTRNSCSPVMDPSAVSPLHTALVWMKPALMFSNILLKTSLPPIRTCT